MKDQQPAPSASDDAPEASVTPDAQLLPLDDRQVNELREAGREWAASMPDRQAWGAALPIDPDLKYMMDEPVGRSVFVSIRSRSSAEPDEIEGTPRADELNSRLGRGAYGVRRVLIGPPLRSTAIAEERMSRLLALPVLSPDALSSVAYGPEAMLAVLVLAGSAELTLSLPIGAVLVVLMLAVGLGYRQVIRAYPHGGGSYIVAKDSLGPIWGLLAAAGLILDYILTVAVSVAAGVAAVTSALPSVSSATVLLGLVVIAILALGNLRGVKSAGALFAAPTYMFIVAIGLIVIVGLIDSATHGFHAVPPPPRHPTEALGVFLILRAFSSGATAMTGIEVISNAVPVFEPPEAENARSTLTIMIALLVSMFLGIVLVAYLEGVAPGSQTVLSQIAHRTVGGGVLYAYIQIATTAILLIAANSAVNGFPRLLYFMARDRYAPAVFLRLGDRLAFTAGIIVLAVPAAIVYAAFSGQTEPLIPLFAVGVFVRGLHSRRGWHGRPLVAPPRARLATRPGHQPPWRRALWRRRNCRCGHQVRRGCLARGRAGSADRARLRANPQALPAGSSPAPPGRDDPPVASPTLGSPSRFRDDGHAPAPEAQDTPSEIKHLVVVPVAVLDLAALRALAYAASLHVPILAVHVSPSEEESRRFHRYWKVWGAYLPLEVLVSPYRATVAPLANYIEALHRQQPDITLTVIVPEIVPAHRWESGLHGRTAQRLQRSLIRHEGIVITSIPFHLEG